MFFSGPANTNNAVRTTKRRANTQIDFRSVKSGKITNFFAPGTSGQNNADEVDPNATDHTMDLEKDDENISSNGEINTKKHNLNSDGAHVNIITSWADLVANDEKSGSNTKQTPIQVGNPGNDDYSGVLKLLRENFNADSYEWFQMKKSTSPRIICYDPEIKQQVMLLLRNSGFEYNTFGDKSTKRKAVIIRGLLHGRDEDNMALIRGALDEYQVTGVQSVTRYMTPHMKRSDNPNVLYQLVLDSSTDEALLSNIKIIDNFRVKFEKIHTSKIIQCRRCQRFSHTAASCGYKYRCVQCTNTHGPGSCPRQTNKKLPMGCVNCWDGGLQHANHTANDLIHCQYYNKIKNQRGVAARPTITKPKTDQKTGISNKKNYEDIKSGDFNRATLNEVITPSNSGSRDSQSMKKTRKFIKQYRPSAATASGSHGKSMGKSNGKSQNGKTDGSGQNKKEVFSIIGQLMNALQKII